MAEDGSVPDGAGLTALVGVSNVTVASGWFGIRTFTRMPEPLPTGAAEHTTDAPGTLTVKTLLIACCNWEARPWTVWAMVDPLPSTFMYKLAFGVAAVEPL